MDSRFCARRRLDAVHPDRGGLLAIPCDCGRAANSSPVIDTTFLLLALVLGWPAVLALVSLFGRNSPLVASRQQNDEAATRIERGRGAS